MILDLRVYTRIASFPGRFEGEGKRLIPGLLSVETTAYSACPVIEL